MADVPVPELTGRTRLWAPVVIWMAVIFTVSSLTLPPGARFVPDWLSHGFEYAVLGGLVVRALAGGAPSTALVLAGAVGLATAYGVTDEIHQSFVPGREADALDVVKDLAGATVGALAWAAIGRPAAKPDEKQGLQKR